MSNHRAVALESSVRSIMHVANRVRRLPVNGLIYNNIFQVRLVR